jgi:hypothetical protein
MTGRRTGDSPGPPTAKVFKTILTTLAVNERSAPWTAGRILAIERIVGGAPPGARVLLAFRQAGHIGRHGESEARAGALDDASVYEDAQRQI